MTTLADFPVSQRWPAQHPQKLQLYSLPTPNGVKVSIMLEGIGLLYEAHRIDFANKDQRTPEYLALNPNGKIPAIVDPDGPNDAPLALYESCAILLYLSDKTGKLMPIDPARRYETIQWMFWQASAVGPMFGQLGYFHKFEGRDIADKRPLAHYVDEVRKLLGVLDRRLENRAWIMGPDFSVADVATLGMVRNLIGFYDAAELVGFGDFSNVSRWLGAGMARPAVERGVVIL